MILFVSKVTETYALKWHIFIETVQSLLVSTSSHSKWARLKGAFFRENGELLWQGCRIDGRQCCHHWWLYDSRKQGWLRRGGLFLHHKSMQLCHEPPSKSSLPASINVTIISHSVTLSALAVIKSALRPKMQKKHPPVNHTTYWVPQKKHRCFCSRVTILRPGNLWTYVDLLQGRPTRRAILFWGGPFLPSYAAIK